MNWSMVTCQHSFGITLRLTGPVPMDSRQLKLSIRNCVTRLIRDWPDGVWTDLMVYGGFK